MTAANVIELSAQLLTELAASQEPPAFDVRAVPLRHSWLKQMARSPLHAYHAAKTSDDSSDSLALRMGSAAHALMFGDKKVAVFQGKTRQGKEWDAFQVANKGAVLVNRREHREAQNIIESLTNSPLAMQVLACPGSMNEKTLLWTQQGRARRSTPDVHTKSHLVELKTTRNADPQKFTYDATRLAYHCQLADQCDAMEAVYGFMPKSVYIVAVESSPPCAVTVFDVTPGALDMGRRMNRLWMERWLQCEAAGVWPAYSESIVPFEVVDKELALVWDDEGEDK